MAHAPSGRCAMRAPNSSEPDYSPEPELEPAGRRPPAPEARPSGLALRAVVRAPPAERDALDGRATPPAREALAPVDLQLVLVLARLAEQVDVRLVRERGPPVPDGVLHDLLDRAVEPADLARGQGVRHAVVTEPGAEEHLVGVDVPEAADDLLVHE